MNPTDLLQSLPMPAHLGSWILGAAIAVWVIRIMLAARLASKL